MACAFRRAGPGDFEALLALNREAAALAMPPDWLRDATLQADDRRFALVAEFPNGRIDAFCLATCVLDEASLLLVVVSSRARRCGLGRALMGVFLDHLPGLGIDRCLLEVRETNIAALALYRSCGFVTDGRRRGYYPALDTTEREDAILMSWTGKGRNHGRT